MHFVVLNSIDATIHAQANDSRTMPSGQRYSKVRILENSSTFRFCVRRGKQPNECDESEIKRGSRS